MRKNIEPRKNKKGEVVDGLHEIGQVAVGSGQICLADPCYITKGEEPDITITTNFGDGMFPVFEEWEDNKRIALVVPLETELHTALKDEINKLPDPPSYKKDNLKPGEFNPKDIGIDGYKYIEDMNEDYKWVI